MDDYRTRRLDAGSEEPEPMDDEESELQGQVTPPPLPEEEREAPPPLPEPEDAAPPPLPMEEEALEVGGRSAVFYEAPPQVPSESREVGRGEVITPSTWYTEEPVREREVPSPFEEPVITPEPVRPQSGPQPRLITPEPVTTGGGAQVYAPSGPGTPKKKSNTALIIGIVVGVLLLCCCCILGLAAIGWWVDSGQYNYQLPLGSIWTAISSLLL